MIKSTLLAFLLIFSWSAWAQTEKGAILLGGTATANFQKNYSFGVFPQVGYFIIDNLALGTGITAYYVNVDTDDSMGNNFRSHSTIIGGSPFVRYYFGKSTPTRLFTQAGIDLNHQWSKSRGNSGQTQKTVYNFSTLRAGVGVVHFITQQVGLEALLAYTSSKASSRASSDRVTLNVGLQIYLPASKKQLK